MIYLLRHGEIELEGEKRFVGQVDLPLTVNGLRQAQLWQRELSPIVFHRIYSSDLVRCRVTARIIAGDKEDRIELIPRLREIHLGGWEGLTMAEVRTQFPENWQERGEDLVYVRPPGGESFSDLHGRVVPVFEQIAGESDGDVLIVAHAGVNRVILCHILGMPLANLFRLDQDYGALNIIDCEKDLIRVKAINVRPRGSGIRMEG